MMPWGHLAVGYLAYTFGTHIWKRRTPDGLPTLALAFGTQFPDLFDKPLNWWLSVYDGRAIGHSLLTTTVLCAIVIHWSKRSDREPLGIAFSVGVFTHLLSDAYGALLSGAYGRLTWLLWPLFPAPTYPKDSFLDHLQQWILQLQTLSPGTFLRSQFGLQLVLFFVLLGVWAVDGFPGLKATWRLLVGVLETIKSDSR